MRAPLAALLAWLAVACAPSQDARFAATEAHANATARAGRHAEAAVRWLEAARIAASAADREEAEYRAATSYARAQKTPQALALYERLARGPGERAARASFDRARLVREHDVPRGNALLVSAIRSHPSSGLAPRALREHLGAVEARGGVRAALDESVRLLGELSASELDENLRYERARLLERSGSLTQARDAYLETAAHHPYPEGALWDDALARAAGLEDRLGRPRAAIALFERLLAERESSYGLASYDRARYAEARFRIAEIRRDRLSDPAGARREFRRVYGEHPKSLLGDDALWQEALVARASGDAAGACTPLALLVRNLPDSRFAPCARRICPGVPAPPARECHIAIPEPPAAPSEPPDQPQGVSSSSSSFSSSSSSSSSL